MNFQRLIAVCLVSPVVIVLGINILSSNIAAESDSFLSEGSLVLTTVQAEIEPSQTLVSVTGGQECFYDQKFIIRPEKRITPFSKYGQKESSYIVCGLNTLYGNSDDTGAITRNGTHVAGQVYYNENNSLRKVRYLAIPNSDSFVEYFPRKTAGNYLRLHKNISQNLETDVNKKTGELKHYFTDTGGQDIVDREANKIIKDQGANYSADGRWMAFDSNLGLLRLDTTNGEYFIFEKPHINGSTGDPRFEFALSNDGRYVVVIKSRIGSAKIYDLGACQGDNNLDQPLMCDSLDLKKYVEEKDPKPYVSNIIRPSFTDDQSLKFYRAYKVNDKIHRDLQLLSVGEPVLFNYLGLGDSFSSGEGAYNYRPATDVVNPLNKCHVSLDSYPLLLGADMGINSYNSVACSGAKIQDIIKKVADYNGKESQSKGKSADDFDFEIINNFLPGYRIQQNFVQKYLPKQITISVGGNDIGFSGIITKCISLPEDCFSKQRERADLAKLINDQYYPLVETYGRLKSASGGGTVNVIGYPQITSEDGACAANARFSQEELRMATQLINYLNSMIERAAKRAGVVYVDVAEALAGHRLCEGAGQALAVNGLTAGDDKFFDIGPIANESYHPNKLGQKLLQTKILSQTSSLSLSNPGPDLSVADPKVEDAADFTGLDIVDFSQPVFELIDGATPLWLKGVINGVTGRGFAPGSVVDAFVTSEPHSLGQFTADDSGEVSFSSSLDDEIPYGIHTLHLSGVNVAGEQIEQLQTIYFGYTAEDFDGDGVLNSDEGCLVVEPGGVDIDQDGIDDACDGVIGEAPVGEPRRLPGFETFPDPKPPANNPETVAGNEPQPDTISSVNPSTNQAPSNSSSLQPNAGQAQNTGGNLQTGGGVQTGGNSSVNNLLNQGQLPSKPLSVGVAGASADSSTASAQAGAQVPAQSNFWWPSLFLVLFLLLVSFVAYLRFRQKAAMPEPVADVDEFVPTTALSNDPPPKKAKKHKKKSKKPHRR